MHVLSDTKAYIIQVTTKDRVFAVGTTFSESVAKYFIETAKGLDITLQYYQGLFYDMEDRFFETHGDIPDQDERIQQLYEKEVDDFFSGLDLPDGIHDYDTLTKMVLEYESRDYDVVETPIIMPDKNNFN
jgi:hypothetical protein